MSVLSGTMAPGHGAEARRPVLALLHDWVVTVDHKRLGVMYVATGLVLAAPLILRHPFFRTPLGRTVEVVGLVALLPKLAEQIRGWEPSPTVVRPAPR